MGKAKVLGQFNPRKTGSTIHVKAPWQGQKKKPKNDNPVRLVFFDEFEADTERKKQGGVFYAAKQSKA